MDDRFMTQMSRAPSPEFARDLKTRLESREEQAAMRAARWRPVLAFGGAALAVTIAFTFPSVRASAQAFLDQFRVRNFTAIPFNPERLEALRQTNSNNALMVFDQQEVLQDPGMPQPLSSPEAGAAALGFPVLKPGTLPRNLAFDHAEITGEGRARLTANAGKLRTVLDALDLRDVQVPPGTNGATVALHAYPMLTQTYRNGDKAKLDIMQTRSPEVDLPPGLDLASLGEVGLRILGLDPAEAHRLASTIDWRSTMVVPVPATAGSFRRVEVRGQQGLMVSDSRSTHDTQRGSSGTMLMWTEGDQVIVLGGDLSGEDLVLIANSLR